MEYKELKSLDSINSIKAKNDLIVQICIINIFQCNTLSCVESIIDILSGTSIDYQITILDISHTIEKETSQILKAYKDIKLFIPNVKSITEAIDLFLNHSKSTYVLVLANHFLVQKLDFNKLLNLFEQNIHLIALTPKIIQFNENDKREIPNRIREVNHSILAYSYESFTDGQQTFAPYQMTFFLNREKYLNIRMDFKSPLLILSELSWGHDIFHHQYEIRMSKYFQCLVDNATYEDQKIYPNEFHYMTLYKKIIQLKNNPHYLIKIIHLFKLAYNLTKKNSFVAHNKKMIINVLIWILIKKNNYKKKVIKEKKLLHFNFSKNSKIVKNTLLNRKK